MSTVKCSITGCICPHKDKNDHNRWIDLISSVGHWEYIKFLEKDFPEKAEALKKERNIWWNQYVVE